MINIVIQILAGAFGTLGLVAIIGAPKKYLFYCAAIGSLSWIVYYALFNYTDFISEPIATFAGTAVGILLSRFYAVREKCPVTIFLVSAIFPLVPGAGIFWTAFYLATNQLDLAGSKGFLAIKLALAIVLGIVIVFEIPQSFFGKLEMLLPSGKRNR